VALSQPLFPKGKSPYAKLPILAQRSTENGKIGKMELIQNR